MPSLQADVRNFFVSIHKDILFGLLKAGMPEPWLLALTEKVLYHDPRQNCFRKAKQSAFDRVPVHKPFYRGVRPRTLNKMRSIANQYEKGKEVDFVVLRNRKPLFAVECKLSDGDVAPSLLDFKSKLDIPQWYQEHLGTKERVISPNFKILPFEKLCKELSLV